MDWFAYVDGPEVPTGDANGTTRHRVPKKFAGLTGSLSGVDRSNEVGVKLEGALDFPFKKEPEKDGYLPGLAIGLGAAYASCVSDGGCPQDVLAYDDPLTADNSLFLALFANFRIKTKLQFRFSVPVTFYALNEEVHDDKGRANTIIPSLTASVAEWEMK